MMYIAFSTPKVNAMVPASWPPFLLIFLYGPRASRDASGLILEEEESRCRGVSPSPSA